MLRVANWYPVVHRNDGNPLYITAALKRMQEKGLLKIDHLQPYGDTSHWGKYDLHFWIDWGEDAMRSVINADPIIPKDAPLIYWASDTHLGYDHRLGMAKQASLVFVAQKDCVERFKQDGVEAPIYWLPHSVEPRAYCDIDDASGTRPYNFLTKKYDVCFIGHVNSMNRIEALDRLFKEFPNFYYGQKRFNDAAEKYCQSKVVFNVSMKNELNMRVFETLGSGSFLLTDRCQNIEEIFEDGKHLVLYDSLDDMVEKAKYYLEHDDEREAIAKAGYAKVMQSETIDHRLNFMLEKAIEHGLIRPEDLNVSSIHECKVS